MIEDDNPYSCPKWNKLLTESIRDIKNLTEDEYFEKCRKIQQELLAHPTQCNRKSCKRMCQMVFYQLLRVVKENNSKSVKWNGKRK